MIGDREIKNYTECINKLSQDVVSGGDRRCQERPRSDIGQAKQNTHKYGDYSEAAKGLKLGVLQT